MKQLILPDNNIFSELTKKQPDKHLSDVPKIEINS
ncbi:type II toxin-antitoxin system VapC family toxin [Moraxella bovis]|nr:type II toxin-antitoxin system VapC family toxin [Moraxella bovis]